MSPRGQWDFATRSSRFMAGFSCWAEDTVSYFLGWVLEKKLMPVRLCALQYGVEKSWEHFVSCENKQY